MEVIIISDSIIRVDFVFEVVIIKVCSNKVVGVIKYRVIIVVGVKVDNIIFGRLDFGIFLFKKVVFGFLFRILLIVSERVKDMVIVSEKVSFFVRCLKLELGA